MDWKSCARISETLGVSRFEGPLSEKFFGFDCNPEFTYNDIWGAISWFWTWPGDYILSDELFKSFFEMSSATVIGSGWSTALTWIFVLFLLRDGR